jgi:hypothetical protein
MKVEINKPYSFDSEQYLFKYIDLHKLMYFLNTEKLFFSPLSYFDDPLEGITEDMLYKHSATDDNQNPTYNTHQQEHPFSNYLKNVQRKLFASCWFLGIRESLAMWETYSNRDSVALRFKPQHLCDIMSNSFATFDMPDFKAMVHGKVEYFKLSPFDPVDTALKNCGHKYSGFLKDLSYKHEEEFRFLLMQNKETDDHEFYEFSPGPITNLDFNIITHPYMEDWKYNNICLVLKNKGMEHKLLRSQIPTRKQVFPAVS